MGLGIPIIGAITDIIDRVVPDPKQKAAISLELAKLESAQVTGQLEINKAEALHRSIFVAGWRPFIGWICGVGLAYGVIIQPLISWVAKVIFGYDGEIPAFDSALLIYALGGMLGLGAMRSYDKKNGTDNDILPITSKAKAEVAEVIDAPKKKKFLGIFSNEELPEKTPWEV